MIAALLLAAAAPAMVVVREEDVKREEPPPHGGIGMSTAYRISDAVSAPRSFEFRKRVLHIDAAIGIHRIDHDEIYYLLSGTGMVHSDGEEKSVGEGTAVWLYHGANVGIRQTGNAPLVLIIAYPNTSAK